MDNLSFESVEELKEFLTWCKENKIQEIKIGELIFAFNPAAFIDLGLNNETTFDENVKDLSVPPVGSHLSQKDEELLFWSVDDKK